MVGPRAILFVLRKQMGLMGLQALFFKKVQAIRSQLQTLTTTRLRPHPAQPPRVVNAGEVKMQLSGQKQQDP